MRYRVNDMARWCFAGGCAMLVLARMLNSELTFDWMSLVLVALAGAAVLMPHGGDEGASEPDKPQARDSGMTEAEVNELSERISKAGLEVSVDGGEYAMLLKAKPTHAMLPVARALLEEKLRGLCTQAKLDVSDLSGGQLLTALAGAGLTTDEQYDCLVELMRLLDEAAGSRPCDADEALLKAAVRVLEMLDGTLG